MVDLLDVRILSRSSRKYTGIDSHELQGLDVVQCAALLQTNHGIVNLIMNEYACYGKGHTIHSSGQIEWFKNSVDDRSVQVGGKQRICTTDGYAMPLTCRGGLMYLSIGPMTLMRDMPLTLILMNLGITPKGQFKLSASWMTLHPL